MSKLKIKVKESRRTNEEISREYAPKFFVAYLGTTPNGGKPVTKGYDSYDEAVAEAVELSKKSVGIPYTIIAVNAPIFYYGDIISREQWVDEHPHPNILASV